MTSIDDIRLYNLKTVLEPDGNLIPLESNRDIPFPIKRVIYVFGVHNQNDRGKHSHHKTKQVLISINGSIDVLCDDGNDKVTYNLKEKNYIGKKNFDITDFKHTKHYRILIHNTQSLHRCIWIYDCTKRHIYNNNL